MEKGRIEEINTLQKVFSFFDEAKDNEDEIQKSQHLTGKIDLDYIESNTSAQILSSIRSGGHQQSKIKMWAAKKDGKYVGTICFQDCVSGNSHNRHRMLHELFWICWGEGNGKLALKLLKTAENYAKDNSIKYISMSRMTNTKSGQRLESIYKKMGYEQDTATHIKKI